MEEVRKWSSLEPLEKVGKREGKSNFLWLKMELRLELWWATSRGEGI